MQTYHHIRHHLTEYHQLYCIEPSSMTVKKPTRSTVEAPACKPTMLACLPLFSAQVERARPARR